MTQAAPLHGLPGDALSGGHALWVTTSDGVRLRVALWPEGSKGTVFLFPGRTEYVEKYVVPARELASRGYASLAVDWRGQGLTERPRHDRMVGHVNDFNEFQRDVDAVIALATEEGLPRPWVVLGHSMGGLIGLATLMRRSEFSAAVFSAPMWGLQLSPHRRLGAWLMSSIASTVGIGHLGTPASGKVADPANAPFEGNLLTTDPEMFAWMKAQLAAHPDLALGGPSLGWVWGAFREMHRCAREAAPDIPCLTFLGTEEGIVDPDAIHVRMASWPRGKLVTLPGARHEPMMEGAAKRAKLFDQVADFLAAETA
ncbi:alpha/beta fold hydrolase [Jannaschia pohangensis]|uniref:Lysophospholipase n=1 Tax=Jannaschia pohangensis TaxID=390807 RepID=A0A1I3S295_9RHOB|nr:alpha/beta hydrolase [Jannaschia pohangensis]SFJ52944.1 lysophospholipase [Jannaschia pohangensis]